MPLFYNDAVDDPLLFDGCSSFSGGQVSFQRSNLLAENQAAYIENFNIEVNGELKKRRGSRLVGGQLSTTRVQGLFFLDTFSSDTLIGFGGGTAKFLNTTPAWTSLFSAAISSNDEVIDVCQLTDKLYFTDSSKAGIRSWDGTTLSTIAGSPAATNVTTHGTRLVASGIPAVPDAIDFSDLLGPTSWDATNRRLRIGGGDGDPIVGHISWQDSGILVCKRNSTWLIDANPYNASTNTATTVSNFSVKLIHSSIGCVAKKTMAQVGQDIWFLSQQGVMSAQKQLATSNNQITVPTSQPIQDIINRIRWDHASKSTATFYNNRYLLSVPVESTEPNTVLCYNTLTNGWSVISGWNVSTFCLQPFNGTKRLLYGTTDGYVKEWLDHEIYDVADSYLESGVDLTSTLRTRAMSFSEPINPKTGFYLEFEYVLSAASFTINAILDGKPTTSILLSSYSGIIGDVYLPVDLPFEFPDTTGWVRKRIPLHQLGPFREIQIEVICSSNAFNVRNITISGFLDTIELNTY